MTCKAADMQEMRVLNEVIYIVKMRQAACMVNTCAVVHMVKTPHANIQ